MLRTRTALMLLAFLLGFSIYAAPVYPETRSTQAQESFRIVVVGDTGIGDRAFNPGFDAVQKAMKGENPHLLLHVGDYIYTNIKEKRTACQQYLKEVKDKLVVAFDSNVVFARGDNDKDFPCWIEISNLAKPLVKFRGALDWEGMFENEHVLIVVLDYYALAVETVPPRDWTGLAEEVKRAKTKKKWVLVAVHIPVVTASWNEYGCCKSLSPLYEYSDIGVDLVFSGHRHSFERTYQVQVSPLSGQLERTEPLKENEYEQGLGIVYVVTGGGGAFLRAFADLQRSKEASEHQARYDVQTAIASRAIMNHYVLVELTLGRAIVTTKRVCVTGKGDPRDTGIPSMWGHGAKLECDGKPDGVSVYDRFEIVK